MKLFNFGENFIKMTKVIFEKPLFCAYNNGYMTEYVEATRGCRQGCCYSPIIFTFVMELLGIAIREDREIEGITIGSSHIKSGQFANDLWTSLKAKEANINKMLLLLDRFRRCSGLEINAEKSTVLCIGPWKHSDAKFYTLKRLYWSPGPIKILGFSIYSTTKDILTHNFDDMLNKVDKITHDWNNRNITLISKITIINHLIHSLFIHKLIALSTPTELFFRQYKDKIVSFLWDSKIPRIAYSKLVQDYDRLGLRLIDLEAKKTSLKASWVAKLYEENDDSYSWFYHNLPIKSKIIWDCNLSPKDAAMLLPQSKPSTTRDIFIAWCHYNYTCILEDIQEICNEKLIANSHIKRSRQVILNPQLMNASFEKIVDIYCFEEHRFPTYTELSHNFGDNVDNLFYWGLVAAIPHTWKIQVKTGDLAEAIDIESKAQKIAGTKNSSKRIYWALILQTFQTLRSAKTLWENDLNISIDNEGWWSLYSNLRKYVIPAKLLYFQYRLLHHALTTNVRRNKWNPEINPKCTFCKHDQETILHLLIECKHINPLWQKFVKTMNYFLHTNLTGLSSDVIILNNYNGAQKESN